MRPLKLEPSFLKCLLGACGVGLLLCAGAGQTHEAQSPARSETPLVMVTAWGAPDHTVGDYCWSPWPEWAVTAFKLGGRWDAGLPGWVSTAEEGDALCLEVDRAALEQDLALAVWFTGAAAGVDLYDAEGVVVAEDLAGVPLEGAAGLSCRVYPLELAVHGSAVGVRLRAVGEVAVRASALFECADSTVVRFVNGGESGEGALSADTCPAGGALSVLPRGSGSGGEPAGDTVRPGAAGGKAAGRLTGASAGRRPGRRGGLRVLAPVSGSRILW